MSMYQVTLKAARVNAGLSQADAARETGVSKSTIISWETGRTAPTIPNLKKLCRVYSVPVDSLFLPEK